MYQKWKIPHQSNRTSHSTHGHSTCNLREKRLNYRILGFLSMSCLTHVKTKSDSTDRSCTSSRITTLKRAKAAMPLTLSSSRRIPAVSKTILDLHQIIPNLSGQTHWRVWTKVLCNGLPTYLEINPSPTWVATPTIVSHNRRFWKEVYSSHVSHSFLVWILHTLSLNRRSPNISCTVGNSISHPCLDYYCAIFLQATVKEHGERMTYLVVEIFSCPIW